jgi:hypothetical protein
MVALSLSRVPRISESKILSTVWADTNRDPEAWRLTESTKKSIKFPSGPATIDSAPGRLHFHRQFGALIRGDKDNTKWSSALFCWIH